MERGKPPSRWIVRSVVALVLVSQGAALLGDLFLAGIVDREPALLIALNPRNRNLALATNQLDAVTYYTVGFVRLVISDPLYFLLGFWYGERALAWTERRSRTYGPLVRDGERLFRRASYPLIFMAPNNVICALSAATGVRLGTFIALNLTGTVTRLVLVRRLGSVFSSPIQSIIDLIARYRVPLLILSAIAVAWTIFGEFRGDNSELATLRGLDDEAGDDAAPGVTANDPDDGDPMDTDPENSGLTDSDLTDSDLTDSHPTDSHPTDSHPTDSHPTDSHPTADNPADGGGSQDQSSR